MWIIELICQIYHWATAVNKTGYSHSHKRTKTEVASRLSSKGVSPPRPLCRPDLQSAIHPEGICHFSQPIPLLFFSAFLTGLTSYSSLPLHFPPPVLLPSVYEGLWGILLFPWQHPRSTLLPTLFLSVFLGSPRPPHMFPSLAGYRLQLKTMIGEENVIGSDCPKIIYCQGGKNIEAPRLDTFRNLHWKQNLKCMWHCNKCLCIQ